MPERRGNGAAPRPRGTTRTTLELLRVDFAMVALVRDGKGDVTREMQVVSGYAYPGQLDRLPKDLRALFEQAQSEWDERQRPARRKPGAKTNKDGRAPKRTGGKK